MTASEPIPFTCPGCWRDYEIVMIDPAPFDAQNARIKCVHCGTALPAADGTTLFQYFACDPAAHNPVDLLTRRERLMISLLRCVTLVERLRARRALRR
jgi:hypothetical protein